MQPIYKALKKTCLFVHNSVYPWYKLCKEVRCSKQDCAAPSAVSFREITEPRARSCSSCCGLQSLFRWHLGKNFVILLCRKKYLEEKGLKCGSAAVCVGWADGLTTRCLHWVFGLCYSLYLPCPEPLTDLQGSLFKQNNQGVLLGPSLAVTN